MRPRRKEAEALEFAVGEALREIDAAKTKYRAALSALRKYRKENPEVEDATRR